MCFVFALHPFFLLSLKYIVGIVLSLFFNGLSQCCGAFYCVFQWVVSLRLYSSRFQRLVVSFLCFFYRLFNFFPIALELLTDLPDALEDLVARKIENSNADQVPWFEHERNCWENIFSACGAGCWGHLVVRNIPLCCVSPPKLAHCYTLDRESAGD